MTFPFPDRMTYEGMEEFVALLGPQTRRMAADAADAADVDQAPPRAQGDDVDVSTLIEQPGFLSDLAEPPFMVDAKAEGFKWAQVQVQNALLDKPRDLSLLKQFFTHVGVWGVIYADTELTPALNILKKNSAGASSIGVNLEHSLSRPQAELIVNAFIGDVRPKALIVTLGVLQQIQAQLFVNAGWEFIVECYLNEQNNLTPAEAQWQAQNAGIPLTKLNYLFGEYAVQGSRYPAAGYISELKKAGGGKKFSLYMLEQSSMQRLDEYGAYIASLGSPPPPTPTPSPSGPSNAEVAAAKAEMIKNIDEAGEAGQVIVRKWREAKVSEETIAGTRIARATAKLVEARNILTS